MIGILGGMGTQAGLDFCNKLAIVKDGKNMIKNIHYFIFTINLIYQEDQSLLVFKQKNYQIEKKI